MPTPSALPEFFAELRQRIAGELRTDKYSRILYSTDASIYQVEPYGVLIPREVEDLHAAVELAAKHRIPLLPRAAGSSLAGQAVNEALVIDLTPHLNRILEINVEERWVRVQPGVVLDVLNLQLKSYGLQFGPDPASSNRAAMGGIVANNATGSHSILYGMTADHVLETHAFLSDGSPVHFRNLNQEMLRQYQQRSGLEGEIYRAIEELTSDHATVIRDKTPRHWRRCGGYNLDRFVAEDITYKYPQRPGFNLAKLLCGSEGTLGAMSEIKLNLVPRPQMTALAVVQFSSIYAALSATPIILEVEPSAIELLDHVGLTLCRQTPDFARLLQTFIAGDPNCVLITEFYGESEAELQSKIAGLRDHLKKRGVAAEVVPALEAQRQQNVWTVRKAGLGLMMSMKGDYKPVPFIEDAAVPPEHLAEYVTQIEKFCNDLGTQVAYYAHASAGCIHIRPIINTKFASEVDKLPQISRFSIELLGRYHGALSSEHGDGRSRSWLNEAFFGKELYGLYRQVKRIFDPQNIFNPGMIVDGQDMRQNLRFGSQYTTSPVHEHYDFSEDRGFSRAVEMCNGAGICRKTTGGTMCPSFMVTQEEEHSTRGRANALRAALSGRLDPAELTSKRMFEVMDLCVECKACKAECPSSVDMAKIKFEFLAQYYDKNAVSWRSRLFGDIARISRMNSGGRAAIANRLNRARPVRALMATTLGLTTERELPAFAAEPFTKWFAKRPKNRAHHGSRRSVVLFNDTFNTYNEPQVMIAATRVLDAAGFEIILPNHYCCGRPMISKGLFKQAKAAARNTVDALYPLAAQAIPIVGLEPSCVLTFRDEYLSLLPNDEKARAVAANSFMLEEFLVRLQEQGELALPLTSTACNVLLHGHCHQKAMIGTAPVTRMLRLPPNYSVAEVDSGCCGMAGSFGYEAEHYDISMQMAERQLLPSVRKQANDTLIAASGFSCRHQIKHGTGRDALHPVEILANALET